MKKNDGFMKMVTSLAVPIILQNFVMTTLNMVDTVMIGSLGEAAIASIGIANRLVFVYFLFVFGIYSGASVFISQYWGVKDVVSIRKIMGIQMVFGFMIGFVFLLISMIRPHILLQLFSSDPLVIEGAVHYLRLVSVQFFITPITIAYSFNSRSVHMAKLPMVCTVVALVLNTFANYLLIEGRFGAPALGITGAAYATMFSRVVEVTLLLSFIYQKKRKHPLAASLREMNDWDFLLLKRFLKTSIPVFFNESTWAVGTTIYYIAFGRLGTESLAVVQIAYVIADMFQAFFLGIGHAAGVIVGNTIGRDEFEKAYAIAKKMLMIAVLITGCVVLIPIGISGWIAGLYQFETQTTVLLQRAIIVIACFLPIKAYNFTQIVGILRNGGDTRFCMILEIIGIFAVGVPIAFLSVGVFGFTIVGAILAVQTEEVIKTVFVSYRFRSKAWMHNLIKPVEQPAVL